MLTCFIPLKSEVYLILYTHLFLLCQKNNDFRGSALAEYGILRFRRSKKFAE